VCEGARVVPRSKQLRRSQAAEESTRGPQSGRARQEGGAKSPDPELTRSGVGRECRAFGYGRD
jgi:hypothetical protein